VARISDTSVEAREIQVSVIRALPPWRRIQFAIEMSEHAARMSPAIRVGSVRPSVPE